MKALSLLGVVFLNILAATAQNTIGLPRVINFEKTSYHGGTQTWSVIQAKDGRIYFANNEGLLSFDGTYWKAFPLPNKTILRSLAQDSSGRIYAGGQGEIGYFEPQADGNLIFHSLSTLIPEGQQQLADIWDIIPFADAVYFRAADRILEFRNNSFRTYKPETEWTFMALGPQGLYAADREKGLFRLREQGWYPMAAIRLFPTERIAGLLSFKTRGLVATSQQRFFSLQNDSLKLIPSFLQKKTSSEIYKAIKVNDREFALGTTGDGCLIYNETGELIQHIGRGEGLQNNTILSLALDNDNNIWAGLNNGISMIAYNAAIKFINPNTFNEVSGYTTRIFHNTLYIGTSDGCYQADLNQDKTDFSFQKSSFVRIPGSEGQVWRLNEWNNTLLMAHNSGSFLIRNQAALPLSRQPSWLFLPMNSVFPSKEIFAGTYTGLQRFEWVNGSFTDKGPLKGTYESLRFLTADNTGALWASHPYRGIYRITISADRSSYDAKLFTEKDGLPSSLENHVFFIRNRVVFATTEGAYEFDNKTQRFIRSAFLDTLTARLPLRYLQEDTDGNIWFCTGKKLGVIRTSVPLSYTGERITYFPEITGQILSGFENVYAYNKENIFIASEKGIIHLNLEKYNNSRNTKPILLSAVYNNDSLVFEGFFMDNLAKESGGRFKAGQNAFRFRFSSPAFAIQNTIEYSYQLQGYENQWSSWSTQTEKEFTNLSEGRYTFQVKSRDNLGNESTPVYYQFTIDTPWYKSLLALIIYGLLLGSGMYLLIRWQRQKLKRQQMRHEEEQRQLRLMHQLELEKNEKELIKLQNEKLASEMVFMNKELADTSLHLVERNEALLKVKEELQHIYKKTGENHDIRKTLLLLHDIEKNDASWERFASHYDEVNNNFLRKLKTRYPKLTNNDLKICTYLQLNLSSKEIAQLMNITVRGVEISRYRLRKKLELPTEISLSDFLNSLTG